MYIPIVDCAGIGLLVEEDKDVKLEDYKSVGDELYKALSTVGFAYLKNTGISDEEIAKVQKAYHDFFRLDLEIKKKFNYDEHVVGYVWPGHESLGEYGEGSDYKEAFNVNGVFFTNSDEMSPEEHVPGFRDKTMRYCEICAKMSIRLFTCLGYGLKLKDINYFINCHTRLNGRDNHTALRSNLYPPITDDIVDKEKVRLGAHSDYGTFTLLFQDDVGGLQVKNTEGEFVDATPIPGTVVLNIGDTLNLWTEGRLKSTVHRVTVSKSREKRIKPRTSLAYFLHSDDEVPVVPPEYLDTADPPQPDKMLFDPSLGEKTALDWLMYKFKRAHRT